MRLSVQLKEKQDEPESPQHKYIRTAHRIACRSTVRQRSKNTHKAVYIGTPRGRLDLRLTVQGNLSMKNKSRFHPSNSTSRIRPQLPSQESASTFAPLSIRKNELVTQTPDLSIKKQKTNTNFFLTFRLPHLKNQQSSEGTERKDLRDSSQLSQLSISTFGIHHSGLTPQKSSTPRPKPDLQENKIIIGSVQEVKKNMKNRAEDILSLTALINKEQNALKCPIHLVEDEIMKIEYRENVRISVEGTRLSILQGIKIEEKELRSLILKQMKKAIFSFEKRILPVSKILASFSSRSDRLKELVVSSQLEKYSVVKMPFSFDPSINETLSYLSSVNPLEIHSFCKISILYSRLVLQRIQSQVSQIYRKQANAKKIWTRQGHSLLLGPLEISKQLSRISRENVYNLLLIRNKAAATDIENYYTEYNERHYCPE